MRLSSHDLETLTFISESGRKDDAPDRVGVPGQLWF